MIDPVRRLQYLEAMGIEVWLPRSQALPNRTLPDLATSVAAAAASGPAADASTAWVIGPGKGQTLLLCASPAESSTPLASDIARFIDLDPVWAWPAEPDTPGSSLAQAVGDRLLTRVLDFGQHAVAGWPAAAEKLREVECVAADALGRLGEDPAARETLWKQLAARGWFRGIAE